MQRKPAEIEPMADGSLKVRLALINPKSPEREREVVAVTVFLPSGTTDIEAVVEQRARRLLAEAATALDAAG
jgi:hypothetical protein